MNTVHVKCWDNCVAALVLAFGGIIQHLLHDVPHSFVMIVVEVNVKLQDVFTSLIKAGRLDLAHWAYDSASHMVKTTGRDRDSVCLSLFLGMCRAQMKVELLCWQTLPASFYGTTSDSIVDFHVSTNSFHTWNLKNRVVLDVLL